MKQYPSQIPGLPISDDGQALLVSGSVTVPAGGPRRLPSCSSWLNSRRRQRCWKPSSPTRLPYRNGTNMALKSIHTITNASVTYYAPGIILSYAAS